MSSSVRQSNLFSSQDWQAVYRSFRDVDFRAYDFDSIRDALIEYIRTNLPEFNDYIESSEFIAVVELLAFLASSLAFRVDLNSRENFLETAERRESIIRLARFINYQPSRNVPARGLVKLTAVQTNQPIQDSRGQDLSNVLVFWDDNNNPDSFEQFTTVLNSAFTSTNPFGRPVKSTTIGGISTDLYQFTPAIGLNIAYNINVNIRGQSVPFDVVNADLIDQERIVERAPNPLAPFHLIHRADGEGASSPNTGFFFHVRQGELTRTDLSFDFAVPNRVVDINVDNINNQDVYVQEIDQDGQVIEQWSQVPALFDNNSVFGILNQNQDQIFSVISRPNDQISLRFGDNVFGQAPQGIYRVWHRVSANENLVVRPEDLQNFEITIPYLGQDNQQYNLRMVFSLEQTLANAVQAETNDQIRQRAPQVYYTQNRMVNGQDYNVFPLLQGPNIVKLKSINRTHAGHSRFIDINDPTGTIQNTLVMGDDGALYQDFEPVLLKTPATANVADTANISFNQLIKNQFLENFFYGEYVEQYADQVGSFELVNVQWTTQPSNLPQSTLGQLANLPFASFVQPGAWIQFEQNGQSVWTSVLAQDSGVFELADPIANQAVAQQVVPAFRTQLSAAELGNIESALENQAAFGIGYDISANNQQGEWYVITSGLSLDSSFEVLSSSPNSWLVFAEYDTSSLQWKLTSRGVRYVFESQEQARFFINRAFTPLDVQKQRPVDDTVEILPVNTQNNTDSTLLGQSLLLAIDNLVTLEDGYRDPRKAVVRNLSDPLLLPAVVKSFGNPARVYFEKFTDFDGFDYFRVWQTGHASIDSTQPLVVTVDGNTVFIQNQLLSKVGLLISTDFTPSDLATVATSLNNNPLITETVFDQFVGLVAYLVQNNQFYKLNTQPDASGNLQLVWNQTQDYQQKTGRSFELDTLNATTTSSNFYFQAKHFAPRSNRIDPSINNVIEMTLLTFDYLQAVTEWKNSSVSSLMFPVAPTTQELRLQFADLEQFKMTSDQIIFKPAKFKVLFGKGAEPELAARFKVVKLPTATITDNEIKTRVVQAIDQYFDIRNWDFGESFFYTELGAFIHQQLNNVISTVVIVPQKAKSAFGNLFQIKPDPNELFLSTATVNDVEVVRNLTQENLRIQAN